jgi:hypothetical protein
MIFIHGHENERFRGDDLFEFVAFYAEPYRHFKIRNTRKDLEQIIMVVNSFGTISVLIFNYRGVIERWPIVYQ